jgi:hypothetical protein
MAGTETSQQPADVLADYDKLAPYTREVWVTEYQENVLVWWQKTVQFLFPHLAIMVRDYYSAQGMLWSLIRAVPILTRAVLCLQHLPQPLNGPYRWQVTSNLTNGLEISQYSRWSRLLSGDSSDFASLEQFS